jgi:hypothetical protein
MARDQFSAGIPIAALGHCYESHFINLLLYC